MIIIQIYWTPFALSRLDEIFDYLAEVAKSAVSAKKVTGNIITRTDQLLQFPESGQVEPLLAKFGQNSRYIIEENYKISYQYHKKDKVIIITDLFHTKQYPGKLLSKGKGIGKKVITLFSMFMINLCFDGERKM